MSNGQKLLVIPSDLLDAAYFVEHRGSEFETIVNDLQRAWSGLEVPSEYAAEALIAAACDRAFSRLLQAQQLCNEIARALRLAAHTLEEADRRVVVTICGRRAGGGASGGGSGGFSGDDTPGRVFPQPIPWPLPIWDWILEHRDVPSRINDFLKFIAAASAVLHPGALAWVDLGKPYTSPLLQFRPRIGSTTDYFESDKLDFEEKRGLFKNAKRFVGGFEPDLPSLAENFGKRLDDLGEHGLSSAGVKAVRTLAYLDEYAPLFGGVAALARDGLNPALLLFGADLLLKKRAPQLSVLSEGYEALVDKKYADRREAAFLVKVGTEVLTSVVVPAALTAVCPFAAPAWFAAGAVVAKFAVPVIVDLAMDFVRVGDKTLEDWLIDQIDTRFIDPAKSTIAQTWQQFVTNVNTTTTQVVEGIHQAAQAVEQMMKQENPMSAPSDAPDLPLFLDESDL